MEQAVRSHIIASFDALVIAAGRTQRGPDYHDILRAVAAEVGLTLDEVRQVIRADAAGTVGRG